MASCILPTDDTARYWRYMHLLVDGGTLVLCNQFTDQLNSRFPGTDLAKFLNSSKAKLNTLRHQKILRQEQYVLLFPNPGQPDLSKFDMTLLLCLLRGLFGLNDLNKPKSDNDLSTEADLYRLRQSRNEQAHPSNTAMTESEFQGKWQYLEKILLRLGSNNTDLQGHIDKLKVAAIEPAKEKELQAIKASWQALQEQVDGVVTVLADHGNQITALTENVNELQGMKEEFQEVKETVKVVNIPAHLKHLITCSRDFLDDCESDDVYVKTAAYEQAKKVLTEEKVLVISGQPGEGKTTMAKKLAIELSEPGKTCIVLTDPDDWKDVDTDKVPIDYLVIDDIFGAGALDRNLADRWALHWNTILRRMNKANFRIIITTRHYILKEASSVTRFDTFFKKKIIVNLNSKDLSPDELTHILTAHLRKSKRGYELGLVGECIDISSNFYRPFRKQRDFTFGFPQCVDMFVSTNELFVKGPKFFNKPKKLFMDVLENLMRRGKKKVDVLALILTWARNGKPVRISELSSHPPHDKLEGIAHNFGFKLEDPDTLDAVIHCLDNHKDGIFDCKPSTGAYTFSHNVIKDMVGLVLSKEKQYQKQTLQYSSRDFIIEYLTTDKNKKSKYSFFVEERLYTNLSQRLIELLQSVPTIYRNNNVSHLKKGGRCPNKVALTQQIDVGLAEIDAFEDATFVEMFVQHACQENQDLFRKPAMVMSGYFLGRGIRTGAIQICLPEYCLLHKKYLLLYEVLHQGVILSPDQLDISLTIAVHNGLSGMVQHLLRTGAIATYESVYIAAVKEDVPLIKELVQNCSHLGASKVFKIVEGNSALIISAKKNLEKSVRCLVDNGADLEYPNDKGYCALDKAVLFGHANVCAILLAAGSSVNERHGRFKRTPLHVASDVGFVDIVKLLLQHGASVDIKDHRGHFPIHCAAFRGHIEVVEVLLKHNIDQAKQRAISYGSKSVIRGMTVFHIAVWKNNPVLMEMLVNSGARPDIADCFGRTPVYCAAFDGKERLVKLLVPHSNLNKADKQGRTPLHAAVIGNHGSIARDMLLCPLVNVNAVDKYGNTALHEACKRDDLDMALALMTLHNADRKIRDKQMRTSYDVATARVKEALQAKFDVATLSQQTKDVVQTLYRRRTPTLD